MIKKESIDEELQSLVKPVSVLYISSYIPRKCGLATYTKDLTNAVNLLNPLKLGDIAAMDSDMTKSLNYPEEVTYRIYENEDFDYKELAYRLNTNNYYDLVSVQHEYGIYGRNDGENLLEFFDMVKKPVVTTLHTVLENPSRHKKEILQKICERSKVLVVMLARAKNILAEVYGVSREKIVVIHHGVPDIPQLESEYWKKRLNLSRYTIMTSINLISPAKGIEYAVTAIPDIVKHIPNFLYMVIGETHPVYLMENGGVDVYRNKIRGIIKKLGIQKHVRFINEYISLKRLIRYIGASDFYITPYVDKQQAASGALAYAMGAGKVCVSTPYLYAKEMLGHLNGITIPFGNSAQIAKSIVRITKNPKEKNLYEKNAYEEGRTMTWSNVAHQYLHLFRYVINEENKLK